MANATPIHPQEPKPTAKPVKATPTEPVKGVPVGTHDAVRVDS